MATATDKCPGCGRDFVPGGFVNHLRQSYDPRCAAAWDRLQPTYPRTFDDENPRPSLVTDVEMTDLQSTDETGSINPNIEMSDCEDDDVHERRPQQVLEGAPGFVTHPPNTQVPVIFDSDADDSDSDDDQDQAPRLETEQLPSPGSASGANIEHAPQTSEFAQTPESSGFDGSPSARQSQSPEVQINPPAPFVVRFPGAGEVLETQPSLAGYQLYADGLGSEENGPLEWAPFSTQLEWEVARWAKLRGPSSTALSELLQINGVSLVFCQSSWA